MSNKGQEKTTEGRETIRWLHHNAGCDSLAGASAFGGQKEQRAASRRCSLASPSSGSGQVSVRIGGDGCFPTASAHTGGSPTAVPGRDSTIVLFLLFRRVLDGGRFSAGLRS